MKQITLNKKRPVKTALGKLLLLATLLFTLTTQAQVTIGSGAEPNPDALLDLKENPADSSSTKGLVLPRVALQLTTLSAPLSAHVEGMFVYNTATAGDVTPGIYYNDGTKWMRVGNGVADECIADNISFSGGLTSPLATVLNVSGTQTGLTTVAVAGNGTVVSAGAQLNVLGTNVVGLNLEDLGLSTPIVAASDGYLSGINITINVTASVAAGINTKYNIDAYLYEAPAGSGTYQAVSGATVNLVTGAGPSSILDSTILPNGPLEGESTFIADAVPITRANKYAIVIVLTQTQGVSLTSTVAGSISGSMSIACDEGSSGSIPSEPWLVSGGTTSATLNTQDIYQMGQVTIGSNALADPSAALNVEADNKGVLLPRVALTSPTDSLTIQSPTTGLLVYNTGIDPNFTTVGYMFWDGSQWRLFANTSAESATATLNCAGTQMSPAQQIIGGTSIIAGTVLQIPYTGSNGGSFNGATLVSTGNPGVTATIAGSMLAVGNGVLSFSLSGTPTLDQQAPNGITFDLAPFLSANTGISGCNQATVGNTLTASIEETAVMGNFMLVTDNTGNDTGTQYYALQCNSPDGKFSIRAEVPVTRTSVVAGSQYLNVQVRNNQSSAVPVIWNFNTDYGGSLSNSGVLTIPIQRWGGDQNSGDSWTNATGSNTSYGAYWGQMGIYDSSNNGPEYRRYTWIPIGPSKVCYEATIMVALDTTTPATAVSPTLVKCYIKFSQVTAN